MKLTTALEKAGVADAIRAGLVKLTDETKADEIWNTLHTWVLVVNSRATGRLGQCSYRIRQVEVSDVLLRPEHHAKRNNTLKHEVAHAVNPLIHGHNDSHGPNWRRIMIAFGERPERCNTDKDVSADMRKRRVAKAKMIWACQRCENEFPIIKRRKHPINRYKCGKCRGQLYVKRDANGHTHHNPAKVVKAVKAIPPSALELRPRA